MSELVTILKRKRAIVHIKDTEEGNTSSLFEGLLLVTGESAHIAR